jgi:hypothetical protein
MKQPSLPPLCDRRKRRMSASHWFWKSAVIFLLVNFILLSTGNDALFNSVVFAQSIASHTSTKTTPNIVNPKRGTTSVIHLPSPVKAKPFTPAKTQQPINRAYKPSMKPLLMDLDPVKGAHAMSSDGTLEVTVPAGAVTAMWRV